MENASMQGNKHKSQRAESLAFENESFSMIASLLDTEEEMIEEDGEDEGEVHHLPDGHDSINQSFRMKLRDIHTYPQGCYGTAQECVSSRPCIVCVYIFLVLITLCSLVSLLVISFLVTAPYVNASQFVWVRCVSTSVQYTDSQETCSCGKGCTSHYPCLKVTVNYTDYWNTSHQAKLSGDETELYKECSYYPRCLGSLTENEDAVQQFELSYGSPRGTFRCLHNPRRTQEVIITRRYHLYHVVHGMLWSTVIFVTTGSVLLYIYKLRGCKLT